MLFPGGDAIHGGGFAVFIKKTFALKLCDGFLLGIAFAAEASKLFDQHLQIRFGQFAPLSE